MTFQAWKAQVNAAVIARVGVSCDDLPDIGYRDLYDDECTPDEAAEEALDEVMM